MAFEETLVIIKPDGVQAKLTEVTVSRLLGQGLSVKQFPSDRLSSSVIEKIYSHLKEDPYFNELVEWMSAGPIKALQVNGENAVHVAKHIVVAKLREEFETSSLKNVAHASDSVENAQRELQIIESP